MAVRGCSALGLDMDESALDRTTIRGLTLEQVVYIAIFVVAVFLRTYELGIRPYHHDESIHAFVSWRILPVVEDFLKGKDIKATVKQAAAQIRNVARPMSLNSYKVDLAQGLIERTILEALG